MPLGVYPAPASSLADNEAGGDDRRLPAGRSDAAFREIRPHFSIRMREAPDRLSPGQSWRQPQRSKSSATCSFVLLGLVTRFQIVAAFAATTLHRYATFDVTLSGVATRPPKPTPGKSHWCWHSASLAGFFRLRPTLAHRNEISASVVHADEKSRPSLTALSYIVWLRAPMQRSGSSLGSLLA
jgi:hypothetical protein